VQATHGRPLAGRINEMTSRDLPNAAFAGRKGEAISWP
jgi:hypothetical protein